MLRSEFLSAVGGFDTGLRRCQDRELIWRLLCDTPIRFANLTEKLYLYRLHEDSISHSQDPALRANCSEVRSRMLHRLWNEAPEATLVRFHRRIMRQKFRWADRRAAKQDLKRLIESMVAENLVDPYDKPLPVAAMNRRLEQASPRLWQQFSHWWRHHFQL